MESVLKNQVRLWSGKLLITQSGKQEHQMKSIATTQGGKNIDDSSPKHTQRQVSAETSLRCDWIPVFKVDSCTHAHSSLWPMATDLAILSG